MTTVLSDNKVEPFNNLIKKKEIVQNYNVWWGISHLPPVFTKYVLKRNSLHGNA